MRLGKKVLAFVGAATMLTALAGTATARNYSVSETRMTPTFSRVDSVEV